MSDIRKMSVGELAHAWKTNTIGTDEYHTELARRLEAAEAKAATYWAECEAWRDYKGISPISTLDYPIRKAIAATDAAREVRSE